MDSHGCPIWIDPGSTFRLVVKVGKYVADTKYGPVEMVDQEHYLTQRPPNMDPFVHNYYSVEKLQNAYRGIISAITDREQWPEVNKGFKLFQPTTKKTKPPGRQRKKRFLAASKRSGKATRQVKCTGCGEYGHRSGSWRCSLTGTKKREQKTTLRPGRKKTKTDPTPSGGNTPRTRAAIAREAAAKAARAAEDAAAKAAAAAEAAAATEKEILEVAPIQVEHAPPSTPTGTRRSLCWDLQFVSEPDKTPAALVDPQAKKMTTMRKVLASKKKKSPAKKAKK